MCEQVAAIPRRPPWRWQLFPCEPFEEFHTADMEQALHEALAERDYDLMQLEYLQMACYANKAFGIPTLLTVHEVDHAAWARRARLEANPFKKLRWTYNCLQVLDREMSLVRRADAAICVTEDDAAELRRFRAPVPVQVVNTGVDLDYFRPAEGRPPGARLIFVGAYRHVPNVDAMTHFCRKVLPLIRARVPETELAIVGSEPPEAIRNLSSVPGVLVTGFVPDIRPHMAASTAYIVPVRLGAGIRGKILEAWSMAMPVVATNVGCAGLRYHNGANLLVADSPERFADCVVSLLKDPVLRERLGRAGRQTAEQYYGWDTVTSRLENLYRIYARVRGSSS
jgi:glycosyltransferase involved in cell wall biosynthesis